MRYLNGRYYVEVEDHRYKLHPSENIKLRERDETKCLRTQYQVQNETQITKNQKVIRNNNKELVLKNYPKNNQFINKNLNHLFAPLVYEIFG